MSADQGDTETDERLDRVQDEVDEIRARIPKNPGMGVPDPDIEPVMGEDEDTNPPL
jgi:hypothetical protein